MTTKPTTESPAPTSRRKTRGALDLHVVSLPLKVREADRRVLNLRLRAACALHNAVLQETIRRVAAMRDDPAWHAASKAPRSAARTALFKAVRLAHGVLEEPLCVFARSTRDACWIGDHMGGHDTKTVVKRVMRAVDAWIFGQRGKPRFKPAHRYRSIESIDARSLMQLHRDGDSFPLLRFRGLTLPVRRRTLDADALASLELPIRQLRIIKRSNTARERFEMQVVVEGPAPIRRPTAAGIIGVDIGPRMVAIVSTHDHLLTELAPEIKHPWRAQRRIQRAMDRATRANNPGCFRPDGTWIKGRRTTKTSRRLQRLRRQHRRQEAALTATRRNSHGRLANRVLAQGTTVHLERLNYMSFQKRWGRATKVRAAGLFVSMLIRKAESAGGSAVQIETRTTKLSQADHTTGDHVKKPLSLRVHALRDGSGTVQRDLYSAFLARFCTPDALDIPAAAQAWQAGACERLATMPGDTQPARAAAGFPPPHASDRVGAGRRKARTTRRRGAERRQGGTTSGKNA